MNAHIFSFRWLRFVLPILLAATLAPSVADGAADGVRTRRFALMAGINDGGASRTKLQYAVSDAQAMSRVLKTLGGVMPEDLLEVEDATSASLLAALDRLSKMVAGGYAAGVRREVVFYYSGHSDDQGLLVAGGRISYEDLRRRIQSIPAEVRLAILDSCASGAFTRHKGGVRRPPFLLDSTANTTGHAFLTSSATDEVAQESSRIGASFFTHYLVSGLRGAADANRDRRVTLQEAFQFASAETLAHTEKTRGGPQHAAYEFDLVGTSDLVVTDVRSTQATLGLGTDLSGRIGVRDSAGNLVVELRKASGASVELGLEAGSYVVTMEGGTNVFEAQVTLTLGQHAELARLNFHPGRPLEVATARGDGPGKTDGNTPVPGEPPMRSTGIHLGLFPMSGDGELDVRGFSFGFVADRVGRLSSGFQLSLAANLIDRGMSGAQMTVGANILRGPGSGAQLSVGANTATDWFKGAQLSVGANTVNQWFSGAQLAVGANVVGGDVHGAQIAVGANVAGGRLSGAQVGVGANVVRGDADGWQVGAGFNVAARTLRGAQIAGGVNYAGAITGMQIAPVNSAKRADGLQLGAVNVAWEGSGAQVGVLNLAKHRRGFTFGVLNIAEQHDGEAFGVLNLIGNGIHSVALFATESMLANVSLKLGGRHLYTGFQYAYQPGDALAAGPETYAYGSRRHGFGMSIGWRQPISYARFRYIEVEGSSLAIRKSFSNNAFGFNSDDDHPMLTSLRVQTGIEIGSGLHAIVGLSYNVAIGWNGRDLKLGPDFLRTTNHSGNTTVRQYPGLLVGIQYR